ncbi:MAG: L-aspartate oxidase [Spirochaetales bacterium]|nr:MAG: L-aspartate oxidase [Spirochaetales bacterium]
MVYFDVIIVGSGVAGLSAAVSAAEQGLDVCVLTKEKEISECNTFYAQGGIVSDGENDSTGLLVKDIMAAGSNINCIGAVRYVAKQGPKTVQEYLIGKAKVPFCRKEDNSLDWTREAAHSVRRILHAKDESGKAIELGLLSYAEKFKSITFLNEYVAIDIITNTHHSRRSEERYRKPRALGVYALDLKKEVVVPLFSGAVILAAGGVGNLFQHTSNPKGAVGDGVAMAYRAGAAILNAEFVQFHPTVLFHRDVKRFLISESLRGEGAKLMNRNGEYFMSRYNQEQKDLAPRDEVARAIYREIEMDGNGYVYLDTTCIKDISLPDRFPAIYTTCKSVGIDISKEPVPVVPAAHYFCGGIKVDLSGKTSIKNLYAAGENACTGVHGANRLASVSLLEGLVYGVHIGKNIKDEIRKPKKELIASIPEWIYPRAEEDFDPVLINHDMINIQMTMWNYAGIVRTQKRLTRVRNDLNYLSHRIEQFYKTAKLSRDIIELRNAVVTAGIIAEAALKNQTSIGCHYIR